METKRDEQIIFFKDLIFIALHKWKSILCWAILLALVFGGAKGLLAFRDMKNDTLQLENAQQQEMAMEVYESKKATLQQQIDVNRENARQQKKYVDNSVLMNMDPYNHYEVYVSFFVDAGYQIMPEMSAQNPDMTTPLISSYVEFFESADNLELLADAIHTEPEYIRELIASDAPANARTLVLKAIVSDKVSAEQMLQLMTQQIFAAQPTIAQAVAEHTLNIKEQYIQPAINADLARLQQEQTDKLTSLNDSIMHLQKQKNALLPPEIIVASNTTVIKDTAIFAVIGAFLGVFAVVALSWLNHIGSSSVYSERTLVNQTGIKILGSVDLTPASNKLDRKLNAMEGRNQLAADVQTALSAQAICNLCVSERNLLILSDTAADYATSLAQAIAKISPNLAVTCCGSLLSDVSALEQLQKTDRILLIAQCGVSRYDHIRHQVALIDDHGKQLLGCILIGG